MTDSADKTEHHGVGHRARLRKRLLEKNGWAKRALLL